MEPHILHEQIQSIDIFNGHHTSEAKVVRTMMYIYLSIMNGWQVRRLQHDDLFEFKPPRRVRQRRRRSI